MSPDLHDLGVAELSRALAAGTVSSTEITQHLLTRVSGHAALGAFLAVDADGALAQAQTADARRARGEATALTGVPVAHKDIFVTTDLPSTAGSKMLAGYRSPFDATVVQRLGAGEPGGAPGAGMVTLGKLNCDEFAMGSANENSAFGVVRNPWDATRVPGGSSGGSAAAVAAGLVPGATGTDTGGSIRQPAEGRAAGRRRDEARSHARPGRPPALRSTCGRWRSADPRQPRPSAPAAPADARRGPAVPPPARQTQLRR